MLRRLRHSAIAVCGAAGLAYYLTIGGTTAGELIGWVRLANSILAGAFILWYVTRVLHDADRIDALAVLALVLYTITCAASGFPRQSLDAATAALAYVAIFSVARRLLLGRRVRTMTVWSMRVLSVVLTGVLITRSLAPAVEWWGLTHGSILPPVGLSFSGAPWGHRYDLLVLSLMLYPSWLMRPLSRGVRVVAAAISIPVAVAVFQVGSRAVWLSVSLATLLALTPYARQALRGSSARLRLSVLGVLVAGMLVLIPLAGPLADRLLTTATLGQRFAMWMASVEVWLDHPILGNGPNSFPWLLQTTDYFATNSLHPRHPDSAPFQLLPELGLVGLACALIVVGGLLWPLIRERKSVALWPLGVFLFTGIGANPTDFSFLVVLALVWAALHLPPRARLAAKRRLTGRRLRPWTYAALAPIALATLLTVVAGIYYDSAFGHAWSGDLESARLDLDRAVALDPSMALYTRQRGIANLLLDDPDAAEGDLTRATALNPQDDLSWRSLALAHRAAGDERGAYQALEAALRLQRSDPTNLLLLAAWQTQDRGAPDPTAAEIVLAWPTITASPEWSVVTGESSSERIVNQAIQAWENGAKSVEPLRDQLIWLAALSGRRDLLGSAQEESAESREMVEASVAVIRCDPEAGALLDAIPTAERRSSAYWRLRTQYAAAQLTEDPDALRLYELASNNDPSLDSLSGLNPLRENNPQGSVDAWGYDRFAIPWESPAGIRLPSPREGDVWWLLAPRQAWRSLSGYVAPGLCSE